MFKPFDRRAKTAPSHYPRIPFHSLRAAQLLSSVIVGGVMSFFIYHLTHDKWPTPWTFILLMAVSLFSIAALCFTVLLHCFIGLNPPLNLAINGFLALFWVVSWSLLTWNMSGTLSHACDVKNWHENVGIMVCRIYKALFTFTLLGVVSTLCALALDIYVRRQQAQRGIYKLHDIDTKSRPEATRGPFTDEDRSYAAGGLADPRESEAWEAPRPSTGPYTEQASAGDTSSPQMKQQGYTVPDQQFDYDTGYHGGHAERVFSGN